MGGKLIVIEGLDGCGKSTQLRLLQEALPECRFLTFPNYQSPAGKIITDYLSGNIPETDPAHSAYSASAFYAIDRYLSYQKDWKETYLSGTPIITARYTTSNLIYQMAKLPYEAWSDFCAWLYDFEHQKLGIPAPDRVFFLDVPVSVAQTLLNDRYGGDEQKKDIHEADPAYLSRCYKAAVFAMDYRPDVWQPLPCCNREGILPAEEIHRRLLEKIRPLL